MQSLAEHNRASRLLHIGGFVNRDAVRSWSRVICPDCDEELFFDPNLLLVSCPPMYRCYCVNGHQHLVHTPLTAHELPIRAELARNHDQAT